MATRDYKARERIKPRHPRRGGSGFFWFVTGAVLGAFGVGVAWTMHERTPPASPSSTQAKAPPTTKPNFVFHQILPEMEVVVPDEQLGASASPPRIPKPAPQAKAAPTEKRHQQPASGPAKTAAGSGSYLVQVASFRTTSDAERLKAKLALLGIQARVTKVNINGKDWYRVRAGPYEGKQEVSKTRGLLSSNGLQGIVVKLK